MTDQIEVSGAAQAPLVIASSDAPVHVRADGAEVRLRIDEGAAMRVLASDERTDEEEDDRAFRVYLLLDHVRGTHDASILEAYLRHSGPGGGETCLASVGLFGLRRASARESGDGMRYYLDITSHAARLRGEALLPDPRFIISIRPQRTLPDGVAIEVGRVCVCAEGLDS